LVVVAEMVHRRISAQQAVQAAVVVEIMALTVVEGLGLLGKEVLVERSSNAVVVRNVGGGGGGGAGRCKWLQLLPNIVRWRWWRWFCVKSISWFICDLCWWWWWWRLFG
jgi:hypothetical protein